MALLNTVVTQAVVFVMFAALCTASSKRNHDKFSIAKRLENQNFIHKLLEEQNVDRRATLNCPAGKCCWNGAFFYCDPAASCHKGANGGYGAGGTSGYPKVSSRWCTSACCWYLGNEYYSHPASCCPVKRPDLVHTGGGGAGCAVGVTQCDAVKGAAVAPIATCPAAKCCWNPTPAIYYCDSSAGCPKEASAPGSYGCASGANQCGTSGLPKVTVGSVACTSVCCRNPTDGIYYTHPAACCPKQSNYYGCRVGATECDISYSFFDKDCSPLFTSCANRVCCPARDFYGRIPLTTSRYCVTRTSRPDPKRADLSGGGRVTKDRVCSTQQGDYTEYRREGR